MKKYLLAMCALSTFGVAHAHIDDYLPEAKLAQSTDSLKKGYVGAVRKASAYVWDKNNGLELIINSNAILDI